MNFTSKQRATLRSMASAIEPIFQIGKASLNENQLKGIDEAIEKRELIKLSVLRSCEDSARELAEEIAAEIGATVVCTIGGKIVLYRRSKSDKVKHIEF